MFQIATYTDKFTSSKNHRKMIKTVANKAIFSQTVVRALFPTPSQHLNKHEPSHNAHEQWLIQQRLMRYVVYSLHLS